MIRRNRLFVDASVTLLLALWPAFGLAAEKPADGPVKVPQVQDRPNPPLGLTAGFGVS